MKTIIAKKKDFGLYSHIVIKAPAISKKAKPGQFVEVQPTGEQAPFWNRPFCICKADNQTIELLIKEVGQGSHLMRQKKVGDQLEIIGPLGNSFELNKIDRAILVGGGFGVAPLLFLAETLRQKNVKIEVIIGGRCAEDLLLRKEMKMTGAKVACSTNDGSFGTKGLVTHLLEKNLKTATAKSVVYTAGPWPMMAAVAKLTEKYQVTCQASLEAVMACGLGVCNGCVVKVDDRFQRVCKDGPIFKANEVTWTR